MKRSKPSQIHWLLIPHRVILTTLGTAVITCLLFTLAYVVIQDSTAPTPIVGTTDIVPIKPHDITETSYLGLSIYETDTQASTWSKLNLLTGEISELLPQGYQLVAWPYHDAFPSYLIAKKADRLYRYSVSSKSLTPIVLEGKQIELAKDEFADIQPSITEKDKFILIIIKLDLSQVSEFDGSYPSTANTSYSYDASSNKLVKIPDIGYSQYSCRKYDSLNQRYFKWPCGEGVGSATPLTITDMKGKQIKVALDVIDLGFTTNQTSEDIYRGRIEFHDGLFYAYNQPMTKVVILDPSSAETTKNFYAIRTTLEPQPSSDYIYNVQLDAPTNTLVIGGNDFIQLIKFDEQDQAVKSRILREKKPFYANFVFLDQGKAYYSRFDKAVRQIDLPTMTLEKEFSLITTSTALLLFK